MNRPRKYGKALWCSLPGAKVSAPKPKQKRIGAVSAARRGALAKYRKLRNDFLSKRPCCEACNRLRKQIGWPLIGPHAAIEIHHSHGRIGRLLCYVRWWIPVCRAAHEWIGIHPNHARDAGLICEKGQWNSKPK